VSDLAAHFDGVWKSFPRWLPGRRSLRAMASRRIRATSRMKGTRWALQNVSFDLRQGEAMGLIGRNGAGKSTLLRLTSGLGRITRGNILVSPDVASVLTLGGSLDEELTGLENARTAALLSGVRAGGAEDVVDAAIDFAELAEFADSPVRSYSDGMKLRLAFGVVAQLEPDLLLLDEVIAVGDLAFREKCMERINSRREAGMSLLFASHDLDQIAEECDRALWLEGGNVRSIGDAAEVVDEYRASMHTETFERTPAPAAQAAEGDLVLRTNRFGSQEITIEDVRIGGSSDRGVEPGGSLSIEFALRRDGAAIENPVASVSVYRAGSEIACCEASTDNDDVSLGRVDGRTRVAFRWDEIELLPGDYVVDLGVYEPSWDYAYDYHWHAYEFRVLGEDSKAIFRARHGKWSIGS
jgi:lipopolysaccharide transport system ATP-binding protein